jgi:acyl carrier protein
VDQILVSTTDLSARLLSVQHRLNVLRSRLETEAGPGAEIALHPRPPLPNQYVAPETEMERRLIAVWQQVLGFEPIGVEDNFFDLGGDSLIAIKMASRLKQELGMDFPVAKLYQGVTVRTLAQLLNLAEGEEQAQLAAQFAEHKQTLSRRRAYIEHRRSSMREGEG